MNNFKTIYRILSYLEEAMDYAEPDYSPITAEALGISKERRAVLFEMLVQEGLVNGVVVDISDATKAILEFEPRITLAGLEYLEDNKEMKKARSIAKGVVKVAS